MRIWDIWGTLSGQFSLIDFSLRNWQFPYDWIELKFKELEVVFETIERIRKISISDRDRSDLVTTYFYRNFIIPHIKDLKEVEIEKIKKEARLM